MNNYLTDKDIHDLLLQIKMKCEHLLDEDESMAMTKAITSFEE